MFASEWAELGAGSPLGRAVLEATGKSGARFLLVATSPDGVELATRAVAGRDSALNAATDQILLASREEASQLSAAVAVQLATADAILIAAGNLLRLSTLLAGTVLAERLKERHEEGVPLVGVGAAAAFLGHQAIAFAAARSGRVRASVQLVPGLGLAGRLLIDPLGWEQDRLGRLLPALESNPGGAALVLEANAAAQLDRQEVLHALGPGSLLVLDAGRARFSREASSCPARAVLDLDLHLLATGWRYDLRQRAAYGPPIDDRGD